MISEFLLSVPCIIRLLKLRPSRYFFRKSGKVPLICSFLPKVSSVLGECAALVRSVPLSLRASSVCRSIMDVWLAAHARRHWLTIVRGHAAYAFQSLLCYSLRALFAYRHNMPSGPSLPNALGHTMPSGIIALWVLFRGMPLFHVLDVSMLLWYRR